MEIWAHLLLIPDSVNNQFSYIQIRFPTPKAIPHEWQQTEFPMLKQYQTGEYSSGFQTEQIPPTHSFKLSRSRQHTLLNWADPANTFF